MILSNSAIVEALDDGRLVIEPEPDRRAADESPLSTSAIDLRLGAVIARPMDIPHAVVDLGRSGRITDTLTAFTDEFEMSDDGYVLEPGPQNLILAQTLETVACRRLRISTSAQQASLHSPRGSRARVHVLGLACSCTSPRLPSMPVGQGASRWR